MRSRLTLRHAALAALALAAASPAGRPRTAPTRSPIRSSLAKTGDAALDWALRDSSNLAGLRTRRRSGLSRSCRGRGTTQAG